MNNNKKMGRPRKKPEYNRDASMRELMDEVIDYYGENYDDRAPMETDHVSIRDVSKEFDMSILKVRRILITANMYSTEISRRVQKLIANGQSVSEVMKNTGLSKASVQSYLPYSKGIYKMDEVSVVADCKRRQREREKACKEFMEGHLYLSENESEAALWNLLSMLQGCIFYTAKGLRFKYKIQGGEMFIDRKKDSITKATVFMAFRKATNANGHLSGPKKFGGFGASYLYPIFVRIGLICKE